MLHQVLAAAVPAILLSGAVEPQTPPRAPTTPTFRAETSLALLRFEYVPAQGRLAEELRAADIQIREDGVPQKMALFEGGRFHPRAVPIEFTLLFDCSGSVRMGGEMNPELFNAGLLAEYPNASIAVYGFSDDLVRFTRPPRNSAVLAKAIAGLWAMKSGGTPLLSQIEATLRDITSAPGAAVRMLVIVSDGEAYPAQDATRGAGVARLANESGVALYRCCCPSGAPPRRRPPTRGSTPNGPP